MYYYTDWPSIGIVVDEVCVTSIKLTVTIFHRQSTCQVSSCDVHMMSSGREESPYSEKAYRYQFNGLVSNTKYGILVVFENNVTVHKVLAGYVTTLASLRK